MKKRKADEDFLTLFFVISLIGFICGIYSDNSTNKTAFFTASAVTFVFFVVGACLNYLD